jgi:ribose transport system ATP-binding protein
VTPLISMRDVCKAYGSTVALDNVSLELLPGEVHGLMGENGAGKSTLMKILAGVVQPDAGSILKRGAPLRLANPKDALEQGISTVFQELSLLPNLSIAENMFLGKEPTSSLRGVDYERMNRDTAAALGQLGLELDPATLVSQLSVAQQQFVEIARGISAQAEVVILDEPTAALNAADVEVLQRHIRRLKAEGKAIVYISHRMNEVFEVCDCVTVLKDGRHVGTRAVSELTPQSLVAMMVGRDLGDLFPARASRDTVGKPALRLRQLQLSKDSALIDLVVHSGEIVGLAGLEGQGQRDIVRTIVGRHRAHRGELMVGERLVTLPARAEAGVRRMQSLGIGFVPEDRKDEGLFLGLSIEHNLSIGAQSARAGFTPLGNFSRGVADVIGRMAIKAANDRVPVDSLSGGNQQKALLGRYLLLGARVLLIEEPTRGVDVGAKVEIYRLLREYVQGGGAVIVLSRETPELIGMCDRLYVVHGKRIVKEMAAADATEHDIVDAAMTA